MFYRMIVCALLPRFELTVAVGDRATEGATVTDLWVTDLACHMGQDRSRGPDLRAVGNVVVTGERPNRDVTALLAHVAEVAQLSDVDQDGRRGQAELHERQQGVASGEQLGLVAMVREHDDGFGDRTGTQVIE